MPACGRQAELVSAIFKALKRVQGDVYQLHAAIAIVRSSFLTLTLPELRYSDSIFKYQDLSIKYQAVNSNF